MIGLITGMTYEGVSAGEIHPQVKERVLALANSVGILGTGTNYSLTK